MKFAALLRGINVGGHKKILMADLIKLLEKNDAIHNVQTYIQSGNVIFESDCTDKVELNKIISTLIYNEYKFNVPILLFNLKSWKRIREFNPFLRDNTVHINRLYVTLLDKNPSEQNISTLEKTDFSPDLYIMAGNIIYLNYFNGAGRSKMTTNLFEKKLQLSATSRNWKTVCKIHELLSI